MEPRRLFAIGLAIPISLCMMATWPAPVSAQVTFRVVSYMQKYGPPFGLVEGTPGTFFSTGGNPNSAAFSITSQGAKTILTVFPETQFVTGLLVSAANGRFYSGITPRFSAFSVSSTSGRDVYAPQTFVPAFTQNLPDGTLLGIGLGHTSYAVAVSDPEGILTVIYAFPTGEYEPLTALLLGSDGNYYGVSILQDSSGYVYCVTPSGSLTKLHNFPSGSFLHSNPFLPLLQASDGNLYGATRNGGANGAGTIYKLTLAGEYTLLHTFPAERNFHPTALIEASDGNLYGARDGELYRISKSGSYTLLYTMQTLGCQCLLTQGSDGVIYGTAEASGPGGGGIFALDAGLPKPAPQALKFGPQHGPVGTRVRIWGNNLLSAAVQFGTLPADAVATSGPNYIWATVPADAVTGPITITTPGGTTTTPANFTVE